MQLTRHAFERSKERAGLGSSAAEKLAARALEHGISLLETKGSLYFFLVGKIKLHQKGNNLRVYAEKVFIFENEFLITVIHLPNEFKKSAQKLIDRKRKSLEASCPP